MTQRHKHYGAIVAFAEGKQIQYRRAGGLWKDTGQPGFYTHYEYRVKPEVLRYRVALFAGPSRENPWTAVAQSEDLAQKWEKSISFVRWLTDWQEVEV
jgi:hypothetical protein